MTSIFESAFGDDTEMKSRIVALESRVQRLELNGQAHDKASTANFLKINQMLKDMGAAINRILMKGYRDGKAYFIFRRDGESYSGRAEDSDAAGIWFGRY